MTESYSVSNARKRVQCSKPEDNQLQDQPWGYSMALKLYDDPWKIKKVLTARDVRGRLNCLLLAGHVIHGLVLTVLEDDERMNVDGRHGTEVRFWDLDTISQHGLVLKKWASAGSFVLIGNQDFVKRKNLKRGDEVGFQWDKFNHRLNFCVLQRAVV